MSAADYARRATENALSPEPPRPLYRALPPAEPFPLDALGSILAAAAQGIHDRVQAPLAICAQSVLAAANLATQGHADVLLPTGQAKPLSTYFVTVAASGERKSACDSEALWPISRHEANLRAHHEPDAAAFKNDMAAWDKARAAAERKGKGDRNAIRTALDAIGPAPQRPPDPLLTVPEPTYEGLVKMLAIGQPSVGLFSAEGGLFIGGHAMAEEKKIMTAAGLSSLWDGEPLKRVRAGDGVTFLPGRRVSLHLMAQPGIMGGFLADPVLIDQGLLSRMLAVAPESAAGTRLWRDPRPESDQALKRYGARLLSLLEAPAPLVAGKLNELQPRTLPLSPDARRLWTGFADHVEPQIAADGAMIPIRGLANKLAEHAARLAATLALVEDLSAAELSPEHMAAGIMLAQHYASEALRLFEAGRITADLTEAQRLLTWLQRDWSESAVSLPDIYQLGPNSVRTKTAAAKLVAILEDHGWLVRLNGAEIRGQKRREAWRIFSKA